jgi:hypothetical protein
MGIAGQCQTSLLPVAPDWPWWWNANARLRQLINWRNADARLTFFGVLAFTCDFSTQYSKSNTISSHVSRCRVYHFPLPAVWTCRGYPFHHQQHQKYGPAGCMPFHCHQYGCAVGIPFNLQQYGCERCTPFPPPAVWMCTVQGVSQSIVWSANIQGVYIPFYPFPPFLSVF